MGFLKALKEEEENGPITGSQTLMRKCPTEEGFWLTHVCALWALCHHVNIDTINSGTSIDTQFRQVCSAAMSFSGEAVFRAVEAPLFWLGALTAAWLSLCTVYRLLSGFRVWVLGNGRLLSPAKLGKWAGEKQIGETTSQFYLFK